MEPTKDKQTTTARPKQQQQQQQSEKQQRERGLRRARYINDQTRVLF